MLKIAPRPTRRTRAKQTTPKPAIEERLLAAAERLLTRGNGFGTLSVEQLAIEAGIARGTFYQHFRDKGELVARLLEQLTREIVEGFGIWTQNASTAQREDVREAIRVIFTTFKKHQVIIAAVRDTMATDKNVSEKFSHMVDTMCLSARQAVAAVKKRGLSRPGATSDVADALTWSMALYCMHAIEQLDQPALERLIAAFDYVCSTVLFVDRPPA